MPGVDFFVRSFVQLKGLEEALQILLNEETGDIIEIGNRDIIHQHVPPEFLARVKNKLAQSGCATNCIFLADQKSTPHKYAKVRVLPQGTFNFDGDYIARGSLVMLSSFVPEIQTVLIKSPVLANTMREVFRMAWQTPELKKRYEHPQYSKLERMLSDLGGGLQLSRLHKRLVGSSAEQ